VLALLRATGTIAPVAELACSPARLLSDRAWTLAASGLIIDGPAAGQLVITALITAWVVLRLGGRRFWVIAAGGHVGSTLVTYAGIGVVWLASHAAAAPVIHTRDYGISAVWAAELGALAALGWRLGGRRKLVAAVLGAVLLAAFVVLVPVDRRLADVEHLIAFLIGLGAVALPRRPGARRQVRVRSPV
jgi:rhomboid family protein